MNENPCNTVYMYRLIWVFAGLTDRIVGFVVLRLIWNWFPKRKWEFGAAYRSKEVYLLQCIFVCSFYFLVRVVYCDILLDSPLIRFSTGFRDCGFPRYLPIFVVTCLCLFRFVGFLFLLGSGKGCGLWLWHSLDFSLTFFCNTPARLLQYHFSS